MSKISNIAFLMGMVCMVVVLFSFIKLESNLGWIAIGMQILFLVIQLNDDVKALMAYYREFYTDSSYPTLFSLKQKMLELGICPKCGTVSRCWSSSNGKFPCRTCGFNITENEVGRVTYDYDDRISDKMKKSILNKRLKQFSNIKTKLKRKEVKK